MLECSSSCFLAAELCGTLQEVVTVWHLSQMYLTIKYLLFFILRFRDFFFLNSFIRYNWYTVVHASSVQFIVLDTCVYPQNHHCNQENKHICNPPHKKFSVPLCHLFSHSFQAPGNHWSVFCSCEFVFSRIFHQRTHKYPFFLSCFFHLALIFWDSAMLLCRSILHSFCCYYSIVWIGHNFLSYFIAQGTMFNILW